MIRFPDAEIVVTGWLREQLPLSGEPIGQRVHVGTRRPPRAGARVVVVRRDGGGLAGPKKDVAPVTCRVWAESEDAAGDLASLVRALLFELAERRTGPVTRAADQTAPSSVDGDDEFDPLPQRYLSVELTIRNL